MRKIELGTTGEMIPILGQGTWGVKNFKGKIYYENWKSSLKKGIELGMTHIDTAEAYGMGKAERIVGEVISEYDRDDLFITTKLYPMHLRYNAMKKAAYKSLKRLGIDHLDLYLIHWPSPLIKIKKQMQVLEDLVNEGKARYIGVSNFSINQFKEAQGYLKKIKLACNQIPANVSKQKHIHESLPYYIENDVILTAYSPLGHHGLNSIDEDLKVRLQKVAQNHNATIQQIAIAWLINHQNVITIPKAFKIEHMESNARASEIMLSREEIQLLDIKQ
ncbi:MAG: aldo/keto reductase [Candidatus Thorarchaeota archaeon]